MQFLPAEAPHLGPDRIRSGSGFIPGLDGLRALSIAIVIVGHFFMGEMGGFSSLGVYIFFVISGFLITRLFFAEAKRDGEVAIGYFYFRRLLRLYPVLIAYMAVIMTMAWARGIAFPVIEPASVFLYFVNYLCSWQEWTGTPRILPIGTLWSLAVEEHFYFIMPFVILLVAARVRPMLMFAAAMCIVPFLLRFLYLGLHPEFLGTDIIYRLSETRFDSIAWGVLLAVICETAQAQRLIATLSSNRALIAGGVILLLSYVFRDPYFKDTIRYTMRGIACLLLVANVVFGQRAAPLQTVFNLAPVAWVGRISYSLYIWHGAAAWFVDPAKKYHDPLHGLMYVAITFVCAVLSYYVVEQPFLKLKSLWKPRRKVPEPVQAPASAVPVAAAAID
ncbi:acyltransferase family protein [Sphingomonas sp. DT-204]|uniref:acyltransferase family protein n=1 Tax=Sphingomonas sp. DT-204 TaxID=3396166 RepID=UPI003F1AFFC4